MDRHSDTANGFKEPWLTKLGFFVSGLRDP